MSQDDPETRGAADKRTRALIVDDHAVVREGIGALLQRRPAEFDVVGLGGDGLEAESLYRALRPNVLILDLRMPKRDGLDTIQAIRAFDKDARILILTTYDTDEDIYQGLRAGARGYLLKDAATDEILAAIRQVARGQRYLPALVAEKLAERMESDELSSREHEVLKALAAGHANKRIASDLGISEGTVKFHTFNVYSKLGVKSRSAALKVALQRGLIRLANA